MHRYIWLVPLLPLAGAGVNGLLGRKFRFSERLVGAIAVGSVALAFVCAVAAVVKYANSPTWPTPYVTSQDGWSFTWIAGGATEITAGQKEAAQARKNAKEQGVSMAATTGNGTTVTYSMPIEGTLVPSSSTPRQPGQP